MHDFSDVLLLSELYCSAYHFPAGLIKTDRSTLSDLLDISIDIEEPALDDFFSI